MSKQKKTIGSAARTARTAGTLSAAMIDAAIPTKKKPTHTPGPWQYFDDVVRGNSGRFAVESIAHYGNNHTSVYLGSNLSNEADAALIAAAPDLLNVCKMAAENIEEGYPHDASTILENLRAAIAKAEDC